MIGLAARPGTDVDPACSRAARLRRACPGSRCSTHVDSDGSPVVVAKRQGWTWRGPDAVHDGRHPGTTDLGCDSGRLCSARRTAHHGAPIERSRAAPRARRVHVGARPGRQAIIGHRARGGRTRRTKPCYLPALERAGYVLRIREPDWFEHRNLKGPDTNLNLHVFTEGASQIDRMLLFRDWLRATPPTGTTTSAPSGTGARTWRHVQHYADAKTEVIGRSGPATAGPRAGLL